MSVSKLLKNLAVVAGGVVLSLSAHAVSAADLKIAVVTAPGQPRTIIAEHIAKRVNELSSGSVTATVFHSSQLGKPREVLEGLQLGTVDITIEASGLVGAFVPKFNVVYLPFRWQDGEHLTRFINSETWKGWEKELLDTKGIRTLTAVATYPRELLTTMPVNSPADVKGQKIRVPESAAPIAIWKALGANPVPVAYAESYQALQQGVVQGVEADPANMVGVSWYEVAKNLTLTHHTVDAWPIMISEQTWGRLKENEQQALMQAAGELHAVMLDVDVKLNEQAIKRMKDTGVTVNDKVDREAFLALARPDVAKFTEDFAPGADKAINDLMK